MCGIMGAVSERDISKILLEGLRRLEYRGYDSAGIAVIDSQDRLKRVRIQGKCRIWRMLCKRPLSLEIQV